MSEERARLRSTAREERARLFVALELPEPVREALVRWRAGAVAGMSDLRLLAPEDLHVTLCFLGWRAVGEIDSIASACAALARKPSAELALREALWLPTRRPRVLAIQLADIHGALAGIQLELSATLRAGGWYAPEARPFLPHVTLARAGKGALPRRAELPAPPPLRFTGSTVKLYRSRLGAGGARYEALCSVGSGEDGMLAEVAIEILDRLAARQIGTWVDGGWGIDALIGTQTRAHADLDLVVARCDCEQARLALAPLGYTHEPAIEPGLPARIVLRTGDRRAVDLHPVLFDERGNGWQPLGAGAWGVYPADGLTGAGTIAGRPVRCLTPELQLRHHLGYPPGEHDRNDLRLLAEHFQLSVPPDGM